MSPTGSISFSVPAHPAYPSLARMFGSSIAETFDLDAERTDDLRLTLSEVCASAADRPEIETVSVDVSWGAEVLEFTCRPATMDRADPRWMLIEALMPGLRLDAAQGTLSFSLVR